MISKEEATKIARDYLRQQGLIGNVNDALALHEIQYSAPNIYWIREHPPADECWYMIPNQPGRRLGSSTIIVIAMEGGEVLYFGSAGDEG
jgi:hypothetical protein